jgi:hypothetical protein
VATRIPWTAPGSPPRVVVDDRVALLTQVRVQYPLFDVAGPVPVRVPVAQRTGHRGRDPCRSGAGREQYLGYGVEQPPRAVDQLDLQLPPLLHQRRLTRRLARHHVVGDERQHGAVGGAQRAFEAPGTDPRHRRQRFVAAERPELFHHSGRHLAGVAVKGYVGLGPVSVTGGPLEVPARVVATGTLTQRHLMGRQP